MPQGMDISKKAGRGADQRKNGIKTTRRTGQRSIKNAGKSVKTGQRTARTTIKTTEQTAKQAHRTAKASKATAKKAAQGMKQSAKVAKKAAKASARSVKEIIVATKSLITALVSFGWIAVLVLVIVILFGGFLCMTGGDNAAVIIAVTAATVFAGHHAMFEKGIVKELKIPCVIMGILLILFGLYLWHGAVFRARVDDGISNNKLVTSDVYSLVRNPIYSAFKLLLFLFCGLFTVLVAIGMGGRAINQIYFYPKPIQDRAVELGLTTYDAIKRKSRRFRNIM